MSRGYAWAVLAGLNAALAAISAKLFSSQCCGLLFIEAIICVWRLFVSSSNSKLPARPKAATVTNFAANFFSSGLAGLFLFREPLPFQWFTGALLTVIGTHSW